MDETETPLATLDRLEARIENVAEEIAELAHIAVSDTRVDAVMELIAALAARVRVLEQRESR